MLNSSLSLQVGPLSVVFHRTIRVPDGNAPAALPPSLGQFPLYKVKDFDKKCPKGWDREGYFLPIHDIEALWIAFSTMNPLAVLVGAGGVNAISGKKLGLKLEKDGYVVSPPQPWLDGWKDESGAVFQFVGTKYSGGKGDTVAEQLIGEESKSGAISFAVFEPAKQLPGTHTPGVGGSGLYTLAAAASPWVPVGAVMLSEPIKASASAVMSWSDTSTASRGIEPLSVNMLDAEMGMGRGGLITQKIYEDPYGLEVWKQEPAATMSVYFVNAEQFAAITGHAAPPPPKDSSEYSGTYFKVYDNHMKDSGGSGDFAGLKTAVESAKSKKKKPKKKKVVGEENFPGAK